MILVGTEVGRVACDHGILQKIQAEAGWGAGIDRGAERGQPVIATGVIHEFRVRHFFSGIKRIFRREIAHGPGILEEKQIVIMDQPAADSVVKIEDMIVRNEDVVTDGEPVV